MDFHKCKVTVIKREFYPDIAEMFLKEPVKMKKCEHVEEGREYIVTNPYYPPEGFCPSAWADIRPYLLVAAADGKSEFMKDVNSIPAICSDPFRPVVFKIEKID